MSLEVNIEDNQKIVRNELGRIITQLPEVEEEFSRQMMEVAVEEIRKSAEKRFDSFSENMRNEISMNNVVTNASSSGTLLTLRMKGDTPRGDDYLRWHEHADKGHWVPVDQEHAPIQQWADNRFTTDPDFLFVSPTPFVKPAMQRIGRRMRQKAESEDNAVAELADTEV